MRVCFINKGETVRVCVFLCVYSYGSWLFALKICTGICFRCWTVMVNLWTIVIRMCFIFSIVTVLHNILYCFLSRWLQTKWQEWMSRVKWSPCLYRHTCSRHMTQTITPSISRIPQKNDIIITLSMMSQWGCWDASDVINQEIIVRLLWHHGNLTCCLSHGCCTHLVMSYSMWKGHRSSQVGYRDSQNGSSLYELPFSAN